MNPTGAGRPAPFSKDRHMETNASYDAHPGLLASAEIIKRNYQPQLGSAHYMVVLQYPGKGMHVAWTDDFDLATRLVAAELAERTDVVLLSVAPSGAATRLL